MLYISHFLFSVLCQVAFPEGKLKNQGKEQPKPSQMTVPIGIHVGQVWGRASS